MSHVAKGAIIIQAELLRQVLCEGSCLCQHQIYKILFPSCLRSSCYLLVLPFRSHGSEKEGCANNAKITNMI